MLLELSAISKSFPGKTGFSPRKTVVKQASISIQPGETVGLFGHSGSGKSTLGLIATGLLKPDSGSILYQGTPIQMPYQKEVRQHIQILFQHPEVSFNPTLKLIHSMKEPYQKYSPPYRESRLLDDIAQYGLHREHLQRLPSQLSGGELQRASIARILVLKPSVIVLDEPTSMLDVITQAQILEMLKQYQQDHQVAFLFISHHRKLCEMMCDKLYTVNDGVFTLET